MSLVRLTCMVVVGVGLVAAFGRAADEKKPSDPKKNEKKTDSKKKTVKKSTFFGEVVLVKGATINVKHANGDGKCFTAEGHTKITGVSSVSAITKGSMVTIEYTSKAVLLINVTKLAPPPPPDKEEGKPVHGTLTDVKTDAYGDTGTIWLKTEKGRTREFQCTNATKVRHPGHRDWAHTMQFLQKGQSVTVEHDGHHVALRIDVH